MILGLPFFGYDWPTTNGTLSAQPAGGPTVVTYEQEAASGHPMYWDPVTDTAWTSYQVGSQWHEAFFENPDSLYMAAQMAQDNGIAGVGIWALGMDGSNDQAMVSALDGNAPAQKDDLAGPSSTSTSPNPVELAPLKVSAPSTSAVGQQAATTTTTAPTAAPPILYTYAGNWLGTTTRVLPSAVPTGHHILEGSMIDFLTADPNLECLDNEPALNVYFYDNDPGLDYVIARQVVRRLCQRRLRLRVADPHHDDIEHHRHDDDPDDDDHHHPATRGRNGAVHLRGNVAGNADSGSPVGRPRGPGEPRGDDDRFRHRRSEPDVPRQRAHSAGVPVRR